jgi:excisionase family DNA binding protein
MRRTTALPPPPTRAILLDEKQVAVLLRISLGKVRRMRSSGELPSVLIGTARRYPVQGVIHFLESIGCEIPPSLLGEEVAHGR